MHQMTRFRARRGGFRGHFYAPPRTVYVETPRAPCCACCGNVSDDSRCTRCGAPSSFNAGDPSASTPTSSPAAAGVPAQAQGIGAGVVIVGLALFFALGKDRAFF
jgi:hypothetical protein